MSQDKGAFIFLINSIKVQFFLLLCWQGFVHVSNIILMNGFYVPYSEHCASVYLFIIHFYYSSNYCVFMLILTRQTITVLHERTRLHFLSLLYCSSILYFYYCTADVDCFCSWCLATASVSTALNSRLSYFPSLLWHFSNHPEIRLRSCWESAGSSDRRWELGGLNLLLCCFEGVFSVCKWRLKGWNCIGALWLSVLTLSYQLNEVLVSKPSHVPPAFVIDSISLWTSPLKIFRHLELSL